MEKDCYTFEWGEIYVDAYNTATKTATLVFNFNLCEDNFQDVVMYSIGHIIWAHKNLPINSKIAVIYDIRGLNVDIGLRQRFEREIKMKVSTEAKKLKLSLVFNN